MAQEILPAFGHLEPSDIERKPSIEDPDDVVSRVDRAVEARLGPELLALLPDAVVIGEEAVHADARVLDALDTDGAAWVIDPIDGTRSFVRGERAFGSMLALVVKRRTQAAWIALPVGGEVFVAEAGAGALLVREAGGSVSLITGEDYHPAHRAGPLLTAANEALAARIRNWFSLDEKSRAGAGA